MKRFISIVMCFSLILTMFCAMWGCESSDANQNASNSINGQQNNQNNSTDQNNQDKQDDQNNSSNNQGNQQTTKPNTDLPADANGFAYAQNVAATIQTLLLESDDILAASNQSYALEALQPKITFMELGIPSADNAYPVVVYAKFYVAANQYLFSKFEFRATEAQFSQLSTPSNFATYADFADLMAQAVSKDTFVSASESVNTHLHDLQKEERKALAGLFGSDFQDLEILFLRVAQDNADGGYYIFFDSFCYDQNQVAYALNVKMVYPEGYQDVNALLAAVQNGSLKASDLQIVSHRVATITSVFQG